MGLWPTDLLSSIGMEWRVAALILGYLCGSVPFGLLIARAFGHGDVRKIGSGNIGATNVLRTGDKKAAALTLLLDGFKGFLPAFAACAWYGPQLGSLAAIGAFVGHCWPIWLGFKGGKGVATYIGGLLGLYWPVGIGFCALWLLCAFVFRISSLSALIAAALAPAMMYWAGETGFVWVTALLSLMLIGRHHANIRRLLRGDEPRIGAKR